MEARLVGGKEGHREEPIGGFGEDDQESERGWRSSRLC
jgi:hypothetical protein